jgi:hypothetical protein
MHEPCQPAARLALIAACFLQISKRGRDTPFRGTHNAVRHGRFVARSTRSAIGDRHVAQSTPVSISRIETPTPTIFVAQQKIAIETPPGVYSHHENRPGLNRHRNRLHWRHDHPHRARSDPGIPRRILRRARHADIYRHLHLVAGVSVARAIVMTVIVLVLSPAMIPFAIYKSFRDME